MRFLSIALVATFLGALLLLFTALAHAQPADAQPVNAELLAPDFADPAPAAAPALPPVPDPSADPGAFLSAVTALAKAGKYMALGGMLLVGLIMVLRRFVFVRIEWFQTDRGGAALAVGTAFVVGFGTALGAGLSLGNAFSLGLALLMAAVSTYVLPKKARSAS